MVYPTGQRIEINATHGYKKYQITISSSGPQKAAVAEEHVMPTKLNLNQMYNTKIVFIFTLLIFFIFGFSTKNRYIFETSDKVEKAVRFLRDYRLRTLPIMKNGSLNSIFSLESLCRSLINIDELKKIKASKG